MSKYSKLIGIFAYETNKDGYPVKKYNLVNIKFGYQSWNYVIYRSNLTYDKMESGYDNKFQLESYPDYIEMFFNLFGTNKISINNLNEYFLIFENNNYYAYNFKLKDQQFISQDAVVSFLLNFKSDI